LSFQRAAARYCKAAAATELNTQETEGQMLQRVMPGLMGMKNILVINDEAHHCYREKPKDPDDDDLKGDERKEAEKNNEAARVWISGLPSLRFTASTVRVSSSSDASTPTGRRIIDKGAVDRL
jgi:type III restriction enzyme